MTYEEQALNNAVEGLYVTFAGYPLAKNIQGCPAAFLTKMKAASIGNLCVNSLRRTSAAMLSSP